MFEKVNKRPETVTEHNLISIRLLRNFRNVNNENLTFINVNKYNKYMIISYHIRHIITRTI